MGARPCFKFKFSDLKIEKTEAASVDDMIEPSSIPSRNENPKAKYANAPIKRAVIATPKLARTIDAGASGFAVFQLVSNPPENIINKSPTFDTCSATEGLLK